MDKSNVIIGFLIGISSTIAGVFLFTTFFSDYSFEASLRDSIANDYFGKLVAIGAILNFLPFFVFMRKKQVYHARGILLACLVVAIAIAVVKIRNF
ncbi:hypothetical protein [Zunongwangia sp. HRR-M8]|uniref:hypothetical protein n=1 Tax=Zunongwangia sp. HRR-M8 TaxID=3015170 RepID=UPI0022DE295C|nr:hypothetical protein [Zunongwangia sp. HRR-M8]WBL21952.1 hypothetical protein PBT89_14700 [Zunongwangia sp. HRR-M8]